jgi:outer membrane receptor protein involved in Fe transport
MTLKTNQTLLRQTFRATLMASCVGLSAFAMGGIAHAQDAQAAGAEEAAPEAIVITGSRIVRRDYQANSPIVTVGSELLQTSATAAIEQNLNKLPQFSATLKNPTQGGDIQPTATNTPGAATISLRGIGSNRNLVLVNGRRATPSNASMAVDINTIPSAAIDRVEIISGGASSTYGADAVAGVTNFIMKQNFQGLQLDGQMGITQRGDNREYTVSGIMGTNFADGKGNISIAFSTNERKVAYQRDRPWFQSLWRDPSIGGTQFFPATPGATFGFVNTPSGAVMNSVMGVTGWTDANTVNATAFMNPDGTIFSGFDASSAPGVAAAKLVDGTNYKKLTTGLLAKNFQDNMLILPLTRFNMYARGNYEINDWISVFAEGLFSKVHTSTVQEPSPITGGWGASIPNDGRAIPAGLQTILNSRTRAVFPGEAGYITPTAGNPTPTQPRVSAATANWDLRALLPFNRGSETDVYTYNMTAGFDIKVPGTDWTANVFASQGESETSTLQTGFASLERYRAVITAPNWGRGFRVQGNAASGGFGASTATCTSGLNPFDANLVVSQDCIDAIKADIKTRAVMQQSIWEADAQGTLFNLPAGPLQAAVGASYRHNNYIFQNDTLVSQGISFRDQALGLYPSGNSQGRIEAKEIYGELLVPVVKDLPLIKELSLELGIRSSHYNTTGNSTTWKALGDWKVTEWLRFRGGYNRAERAPNIAELFLSPQQTFAVSAGGDLCSLNNGLAYSANPGKNTNWAKVVSLCGQLMEASGDATADSQYYGADYRTIAAAPNEASARALVTLPQAAGAAFVFPTLQGNTNLRPEVADTWTIGAVINSPFESPLLNRMRLSVDWYSVKVSDAIGAQSVDIAQRQCFDAAFNPTFSAASPLCAGIGRNQTGALGNVITTFYNNGRFQTQGLDVQLDWSFAAGPGTVSLNSVLNYLISMKSAELAVLPLVEYAGTLGPTQNGLNGGAYRYKVFTTLGYAVGPVNVSLQWQHLPSVLTETSATVPATTIGGYKAYDLFNLNGSFAITKDARIRFGIDNLFDRAPPLGGINSAPPAGSVAGGSYNTNFYDVIGRRFFLGATFKF